jgi:hypothetical protein
MNEIMQPSEIIPSENPLIYDTQETIMQIIIGFLLLITFIMLITTGIITYKCNTKPTEQPNTEQESDNESNNESNHSNKIFKEIYLANRDKISYVIDANDGQDIYISKYKNDFNKALSNLDKFTSETQIYQKLTDFNTKLGGKLFSIYLEDILDILFPWIIRNNKETHERRSGDPYENELYINDNAFKVKTDEALLNLKEIIELYDDLSESSIIDSIEDTPINIIMSADYKSIICDGEEFSIELLKGYLQAAINNMNELKQSEREIYLKLIEYLQLCHIRSLSLDMYLEQLIFTLFPANIKFKSVDISNPIERPEYKNDPTKANEINEKLKTLKFICSLPEIDSISYFSKDFSIKTHITNDPYDFNHISVIIDKKRYIFNHKHLIHNFHWFINDKDYKEIKYNNQTIYEICKELVGDTNMKTCESKDDYMNINIFEVLKDKINSIDQGKVYNADDKSNTNKLPILLYYLTTFFPIKHDILQKFQRFYKTYQDTNRSEFRMTLKKNSENIIQITYKGLSKPLSVTIDLTDKTNPKVSVDVELVSKDILHDEFTNYYYYINNKNTLFKDNDVIYNISKTDRKTLEIQLTNNICNYIKSNGLFKEFAYTEIETMRSSTISKKRGNLLHALLFMGMYLLIKLYV